MLHFLVNISSPEQSYIEFIFFIIFASILSLFSVFKIIFEEVSWIKILIVNSSVISFEENAFFNSVKEGSSSFSEVEI